MAKPRMRENGIGHLPQPGRITRDKDGTISDATMSQVQGQLELLTQAINGGLRLGAGEALGRAGNFKAQKLEFITHGTPDTEFTVPHSLAQAPEGYIVILQDAAASLYTSNFGGWDTQTIYLKCDTADVLYNIIVYV